jgi:hypothetical protein
MELAYGRLEGSISDMAAAREKEQLAMNALKEKNFQDYMSRREREARLKQEMTTSLDSQSAFDRERKGKEFAESKKGTVISANFNAYPMAKPLNLVQEYHHKKNLRESLELQVIDKQDADRKKKNKDISRERTRLDSLHNDLKKEQIAKLSNKYMSQGAISDHWAKQINITKKLRGVGSLGVAD